MGRVVGEQLVEESEVLSCVWAGRVEVLAKLPNQMSSMRCRLLRCWTRTSSVVSSEAGSTSSYRLRTSSSTSVVSAKVR